MEVFWCKICDLEGARLRHPGRSQAPGSAFAWSLLEYAVNEVWGCSVPEVVLSPSGKPIFRNREDQCFSLSHTKTAAMVALSSFPVGADVETRRTVRPALERSIMNEEHDDLDLFSLWTLRESWYKLTGEGDLRTIPFSRTNGIITGPKSDLYSRVYDSIPGCAAAVCSFHEAPPEKLQFIDHQKLIK